MNTQASATFASQRESTFVLLERCLADAYRVCPVAEAVQLRELLLTAAKPDKLILVELIKVDLAAAANLGLLRDLDFYLDEFLDLLPRDAVPADLILEAAQLRLESGEEPNWTVFQERFPHLQGALDKLRSRRDATLRGASITPLPELTVGQSIDDFRILALLGQGAFARVYLARQESMHRLVALKITNRLSDEPQALSQLDHPNIVRVYDQRNCENPPVAMLYMQFVGGGTLADCIKLARKCNPSNRTGQIVLQVTDEALLRAGQAVPETSETRRILASRNWSWIVAWMGSHLAAGLGYAHRQGILHRDVKPANILLSADGMPKLADFNVSFTGIAGRAGAAVHFGGSLAYMSPEQLQVAHPSGTRAAETLDARSDLYSLALVLWELLRGTRPWPDDSDVDDWSAMLESEHQTRLAPIPPAPVSDDTSERVLERILRWTLQPNPEDRPQSGEELSGVLRVALNPQAAAYFFPNPTHWWQRLSYLPAWISTSLVTFPPVIVAAILNYLYNRRQIVTQFPELWNGFQQVSLWVNGIAFPVGVVLFVWLMWRLRSTMRHNQAQTAMPEQNLSFVWSLGHRMALLSGLLWLIAGIVFPIALTALYRPFPLSAALSFFFSLVICGGVSMAYPFFGVSLLSASIYYPRLIPQNYVDPSFPVCSRRLKRRAKWYLVAAALIPLLAMTLLVLRNDQPAGMLLATIATTAIGFGGSYFAVQKLDEIVEHLGLVVRTDSHQSS